MADETIEFESRGADDVARDFRKVGRAAKGAGDDIEDAGKKSTSTVESFGKLKAGALAAAAAFSGIAVAVKEVVQTYAEVDQAQGRLRQSLKQTSDAGNSVNSAFMAANETFKEYTKFGVTVRDQTVALEKLTRTTGNYGQSLKGLKLAIDINAQAGIGLEQATEQVARAFRGEVESLKELGVLTKNEAENLNAVKNESERTARAIQLLTDKFGGGAENNQGLADQLDATNAQLERMETAAGRAAASLGQGANSLATSLAKVFGIIPDEEDSVLSSLASDLENLADLVDQRDFISLAKKAAPFIGLLSGRPELAKAILGAADAATLALGTPEGGGGGGSGLPPMPGFDQPVDEPAGGGRWVPDDSPSGWRWEPGAGAGEPSAKPKARKGGGKGGPSGPSGFEGEFGGPMEATEVQRRLFGFSLDAAKNAYDHLGNMVDQAESAITSTVDEAAERRKEIAREEANALKAARENQLQAAMAGADAAAGIASDLIESEGARLAIESIATAARAAVLFAKAAAPPDPITGAGPQNLPGAIAMAGAAVQLGIAAGKAGSSGGGKVTSKGGGGGGGSNSRASDVSLLGEGARSGSQQPTQPLVVNINSSFPPSPEQAAALADAVARDSRRRT